MWFKVQGQKCTWKGPTALEILPRRLLVAIQLKRLLAHGGVEVATAEGETVGLVGKLADHGAGEASGEGGVGDERGEEEVEIGLVGAVGCVVGVAPNLVMELLGGDGRGVEEEEEKAYEEE